MLRLLGRGAGGEVWLAVERASGEAVAIKRVRPGAAPAARDRLRREAAALAGVAHPHVLRLRSVVGCGGAGDEMALVLDLATGGSLARLVARRGPLPPGEVVTVLVPLAEALAAVHARGVVHGDVTPANVLFDGQGRPVLSDLGVARLVGEPDLGVEAGTPGFLDPAGGHGAAKDVHGLAATGVLALTGAPPYLGGQRRPAECGRGPLLDVLEAVLDAASEDRPDAAALARQVFAAARPVPVRLDPGSVLDPDEGPELHEPPTVISARRHVPGPVVPATVAGPSRHRRPPTRGARPARWRPALAVLLAGVGVATAAVTGIAWAGSGTGPQPARDVTTTDAAPPPAVGGVAASRSQTGGQHAGSSSGAGDRVVGSYDADGPASRGGAAETVDSGGWAEVLADLDATRAAAFATGDERLLAEAYAAGSPALRRDRRQLADLVGAGLRAEGMRLRIERVAVVAHQAGRVRLEVVDVLSSFRLVDPDGVVVAQRKGRAERRWSVTLRRTDGRWVVYDVARG